VTRVTSRHAAVRLVWGCGLRALSRSAARQHRFRLQATIYSSAARPPQPQRRIHLVDSRDDPRPLLLRLPIPHVPRQGAVRGRRILRLVSRLQLASGHRSRSTGRVVEINSVGIKASGGKLLVGILLLPGASSLLRAQDATYPKHKPSPPKIESQVVLLPESVVETQWTNTLKLVNAPRSVDLLNPGQCIRVGTYSTGDNRDEYLEKSRLSFRVQFAGHTDLYGLAAPSAFKQVKSEGLDFVTGVLAAAGVKMSESMKTIASLAASSDHWCVPFDAGDGSASVEAEVESPSGRWSLSSATVQVEGFESGSKKAFKDAAELGTFLQTYYRRPNPARLVPAMEFMLAEQTQRSQPGQAEIVSAFLSAAVRSDLVAARDFQARISGLPPMSRALGLLILRSAGYDINNVLSVMSEDERTRFLSLSPLQDPFDLAPTRELFQHLDMLWAVFGATGQFRAVKTVASALSWRADYEDFDKLRKTPNHPSTLTPSIVRGVTYTAAGWSLRSFQRNDPLVADYIEYMLSSSDTPESVKSELRGLATNPAFKQAGGQ